MMTGFGSAPKCPNQSGIKIYSSDGRSVNEAISELPCAFVSKRVLELNLSYENEFGLHRNEPLDVTHFRQNGFPQRLVLTQKQKPTRKWPVLIPKLTLQLLQKLNLACDSFRQASPLKISSVYQCYLLYKSQWYSEW